MGTHVRRGEKARAVSEAEGCAAEAQEEMFGNDDNVLYLKWDHGFISIKTHQIKHFHWMYLTVFIPQ